MWAEIGYAVLRFASALATFVAARWLLKLSTPEHDLATARRLFAVPSPVPAVAVNWARLRRIRARVELGILGGEADGNEQQQQQQQQ